MTDTNLQFDFLPVNVKRSEEKKSYTNKMQSSLEAYFNDQRLRQANKAQRNVRSMSKNVSSISIDESKKASGAKKKKNLPHRTEYQKAYKRKSRQNSAFKLTEREAMRSVRKNPVYKAREREAKQSVRKDPVHKTKEREAKQSVRKNPVHKTKEREAKRSAREKQAFKAREKVYQNASKRKARENPYILECERIKKQQIRQEKRKFNDNFEINVPRKRCKRDTDTLPKTCQKDFVTIEESIKQFHSDISIGPLYVCTCCHQAWFRKSVSMLKNTHIPAESRRQYCTGFTSVSNEEWAYHTCLSALRERKCPKLSVANGMKWPDKPAELNLHQLEERLIALRIPFMQIRELPRGG